MKDKVKIDLATSENTPVIKDDDKNGRYSFRKRKSANKYDTSFLGRDGLSDHDHSSDSDSDGALNDQVVDYIRHPSTLNDNEEGIAGSEVFVFKTPKRKDQMHNRAIESAKRGEPKSAELTTNESNMPKKCDSPSVRKSSRKVKVNNKFKDEYVCTPQVVRTQTKQQLAKRVTTSVLSSDESTDASSDSSDDDKSDDDNMESSNMPVASSLIEEYFLAHGSSKVTTSDHTLAALNQPKLNQETLQEKLKGLPENHSDEKKVLFKKYQQYFKKWEYLIKNGFNILLFGLGSKHDILDQYRETYLKNYVSLVINGYFPNITIKQVLNTITEDILDYTKGFSSINEQLDFIEDHYGENTSNTSSNNKLYIVVHSIDGTTLRRNEDQHVLSFLASLKNIHILASVDHINCALLWDQKKSHLFSWLWFDATNYNHYSKETSYENSLLVQHSGQLALSSLSHVFRSLTPNAQGIFMLLAKHQLEYKESSSTYLGLSFQDYYQQCREAFLVNSDLTLRAQLTEFKDHKLIKAKKATDGTEHLIIPLDDSTLKEFIRQQQSQA